MPQRKTGLGDTYQAVSGLRKTREWRGLRDTLYDFRWWLTTWKDMIAFVLKSPLQVVKGLWKYRWMATYLTVPAFIDRQLEGNRGVQLRSGHLLYDVIIKHTTDIIGTMFDADLSIGGKKSLSDRIVCLDELVPTEIMSGFPNLIGLPVQTIPIFLASMINQQLPPVYLDSVENYGVPADVCVPLRYNDDVDAQDYAVEEIMGCIEFIEQQTGEKFDWDAFYKGMENYNEVTRFHLDLWEINRTKYPQVTGPTPWLYRMYSFHLHGGMDDRFIKADSKVRRIMQDGYAKRLTCSREMRHKALVWSCPANYYTNFANWLELCWGIVCVMDMETHISQQIIDTSTRRRALEGLALTFQRTTMRKHTKGGYKNAVDEMWRVAEEYGVDTIIMYDQISCKGMDGLQGIFDDQARERKINFIWVQQDLMDCRTISRRDMRRQVSAYMSSVLREEPVDPTLIDFDDSEAW